MRRRFLRFAGDLPKTFVRQAARYSKIWRKKAKKKQLCVSCVSDFSLQAPLPTAPSAWLEMDGRKLAERSNLGSKFDLWTFFQFWLLRLLPSLEVALLPPSLVIT
jgi:hypothetical protein